MSSGPSIPRALRRRKNLEITLSDDARAALAALATARDESRSAVVEQLVVQEAKRSRVRP